MHMDQASEIRSEPQCIRAPENFDPADIIDIDVTCGWVHPVGAGALYLLPIVQLHIELAVFETSQHRVDPGSPFADTGHIGLAAQKVANVPGGHLLNRLPANGIKRLENLSGHHVRYFKLFQLDQGIRLECLSRNMME